MYNTRTEQTDEFTVTDEKGSRYKVIELTEMVESRPVNEPIEWLPGIRTLHLEDGTTVQRLENDEYEIPRSGIRLRKVAR